jgi:hypothetical protein
MSLRSSVAVILICGFTALSLAQAPPEFPKPGPEHKKLEYFLGTWKVEQEIKPNGYVPAGKGVTTSTCTLGPGGFSIKSRAEGRIPRTDGIIALRQPCEGLHRLLREQCRTRGHRHRNG